MRSIAIIGGGFSGTLLCWHLIQQTTQPLHLFWLDAKGLFTKGVAYSTQDAHHLLNVRADRMGALAGDPGHFWRWLEQQEANPYTQDSYVPRQVYGRYLEALHEKMQQVAVQKHCVVETFAEEVQSVEEGTQGVRVVTDARTLEANQLILALGNPFPKAFGRGVEQHPGYVADIWEAFRAGWHVPADASSVLLLGTGLTMVDVALSLEAQGFKGKMVALSRHGWLPQAHVSPQAPYALEGIEAGFVTASGLLRWVRRHIKAAAEKGVSWHGVVDALRPHTVRVWQGLPVAARKRLMQHGLSAWGVHRHRMPLASVERLEALQKRGVLTLMAGKVAAVEGAEVIVRPRYESHEVRLSADHVLNCLGPELDIARAPVPLLRRMLKAGQIQAHPLGLGAVQAQDGSVAGTLEGRMFAVGPIWSGEWLETTAVPELREQTALVAGRLLNR